MDPPGKVVGSLHTARGWENVDSGAYTVRLNKEAKISFNRDDQGKTTLNVDGRNRGTRDVP